MKRYFPFFILVLTFFLLFFTACDNPANSNGGSKSDDSYNYSKLKQAKAWAYDNVKKEYYQITVAQAEIGTRCEIWMDTTLANIKKSDVQALMKKFDNEIYPRITPVFGEYEKIFDDPGTVKLVLLILDIKDDYDGVTNKGYIGGYFDAGDILSQSPSNPHPNGGPLLYIDANPQKLNDSGVYMTVAHEFQHLINFANSVLNRIQNNIVYPQDTWINEGLSTAAEYLYINKHSDERINWFNKDPLGTIAKGNTFYVWGETPSEPDKVLDDYASAYLFFQWLRIHSSGTGIYKTIGQSPHYDYQAVTSAAANAAGFGAPYGNWDPLFSTWLAANYQNAPSGLNGYKGEIKTRVWAMPQGAYPLYPGEAVYTKSATGDSVSGNIKFKSLTRAADAGPVENPYTDTQRLVMYNTLTAVNYDNKGNLTTSSVNGTLPDGSAGEANAGNKKASISSSARNAAPLSEPYRVDVQTVRGRANMPRQIPLSGETNAAPFTFNSLGDQGR